MRGINPLLAYAGLVLIWSTTPLGIKWSAEGLGFAAALAGRSVIGLLLSWLLLRFHGGRLSFERGALRIYGSAVIGIFGAMMATYWSSRFISSGMIAVLFGLSLIVTGFFAWLWLGEDFFRGHKIAGAVFGLIGLTVVFYHELHLGADGWKGVLGMTLGVIFYSLSLVLVKRLSADYSSAMINTGGLLLSVPLMLGASFAMGESLNISAIPARTLGAVLYLGVVGSFIGFLLYYRVLKEMSAGSAMLIPLITPVLAMLLGHLLNAESLSPSVWAGALLIFSGLVLYQWPVICAEFISKVLRWAVRR
ncbi:MAG TPA: DMT family transporter [Gammaproteobacteria bacterium]|nr:DMT family transporter [Gammaproteobacteria bacterium]